MNTTITSTSPDTAPLTSLKPGAAFLHNGKVYFVTGHDGSDCYVDLANGLVTSFCDIDTLRVTVLSCNGFSVGAARPNIDIRKTVRDFVNANLGCNVGQPAMPVWAAYAAVDEDGRVFVYNRKPDQGPAAWGPHFQYCSRNTDVPVSATMRVGDLGVYNGFDWKDSLVELKLPSEQLRCAIQGVVDSCGRIRRSGPHRHTCVAADKNGEVYAYADKGSISVSTVCNGIWSAGAPYTFIGRISETEPFLSEWNHVIVDIPAKKKRKA